jgi:hypothetical protein
MTTPHRPGREGLRWRRWFAPLVVTIALLADYASPAALWTAVLPLAFMAVLLTFRERNAALSVLLLSSWIFIPLAAGAVRAFDAWQGTRRLYGVAFDVPGIDRRAFAACYAQRGSDGTIVTDLPIGYGPLSPLGERVVSSFAATYNTFALWNARCPQRDP